MAVNLVEAARLAANSGDTKRAGVIMTYAEQSMLLQAMYTEPIPGNAWAFTREASIPAGGTRAVNEGYTEASGETETIAEPLKIYGGDLDVDNFIIQTGGPSARTTHEMLKAKGLAQKLGYDLVKGSVGTTGGATADPKGIHGLQARYGGGFSTTAVSTSGANAGQLLANNGASDALSVAKLDQLLMMVDNPTHLLMAKKMVINLKTFLRSSASMAYTEDSFGRRIDTYNGVPILWADINGDTASLAFDENNDSTTSVWALSIGADGLKLIENGGIQVKDLGEQDAKPVWRTRVDWYVGLSDQHKRCVARLYNVADLAAVA